MQYEFTPAARRALAAASGWTSCDDSDALGVPEVLLGLLDEPECRSALLLARHEIDRAAVRQQFPELVAIDVRRPGRENRFSPAWLACLDAVEQLLIEYPRPLELATEHLLLGLTATENDVARWLAEKGLTTTALEAEVHRLSGHEPGPLPLGEDAALEFPAERDAPPQVEAQIEAQVIAEHPAATQAAGHYSPAADDAPGHQEHATIAALRILDAAANRAGEGLRVIEDYLRFALDDAHLTGLCKAIRHDLTAVLAAVPDVARHAARDTQADVGTRITLAGEQRRADVDAVLRASFKRVEQSLRSLEEYSKVVSPDVAAALEQLRYRLYTLERATSITQTNRARLAEARLYVLVDGGTSPQTFAGLVEALVDAGVSILQLRDKRLADRELLERARQLRAITEGTRTLFVMNDRPDLAVLSSADGVHVGQEELSVKDARRLVGPDRLVGVSTHSLEQARRAVLDGADYIGVGPTFPSLTKQFDAFTGPALLGAVQAEIRLPAFAIGGITADNLPEVLDAGFRRIAVSQAVTATDDPAAAARRLLDALSRAGGD